MLINDRYTHGGDIYRNKIALDFSVNIHPLGVPEAVRKAAVKAMNSIEAYPDPYCTTLRESLSDAIGVKAEYLLCGNGAAELIYQFINALQPKKVLLPVPSFSDYENALNCAGAVPVFYPLKREDGFLPDKSILEYITPSTDLLMLCSPNNPTGRCVPEELLQNIVFRCRETGTWLFLDECFLDLADEQSAYSPVGMMVKEDRIFLLRAFTKSYGMAGLRVGYAICQNREMLDRICRASQPWNVSVPAQAAAAAALQCLDWPAQARRIFKEEKPYLYSELSGLGLETVESEAGFLLVSGPADLAKKLLENGILIRSCRNYRGLSECDFRIAVRTHEENVKLIDSIREVIQCTKPE